MAKKIDVLLLQPVKWVGNAGEIVSVAVAYATNQLIPQKKAKKADATIKNKHKQKQEKKRADTDKRYGAMADLVASLQKDDNTLTINKRTNANDQLYESIDTKTVADWLRETYGTVVMPRFVSFANTADEWTKALGDYPVRLTYETIQHDFVISIRSA